MWPQVIIYSEVVVVFLFKASKSRLGANNETPVPSSACPNALNPSTSSHALLEACFNLDKLI
jgi:hypothetical protein